MKMIAFITTFMVMALLLPVLAFANPFLVCDSQATVMMYDMETNGVVTADFSAQADGSAKIDLSGLADGDYTVRLRAKNEWGVSDWSLPLSFTKAVPVAPSNLRVSSE
jgi:hypothetical protein